MKLSDYIEIGYPYSKGNTMVLLIGLVVIFGMMSMSGLFKGDS